MDKTIHTYSKEIKLEVEYTYDHKFNKVYNIKSVKKNFKSIIDKLNG